MTAGQLPNADEIGDRLAIEDVLKRHCRGVDRAVADILKSAYWPDAEVAYGSFNGNAHEFCEILPGAISRYALTQHTLTNVIIDFLGDNAVVESYMTAYHLMERDDGDDTEMTYMGRYIDHMQKRGDTWKILFRRVVMDWNQNTKASVVPLEGLARGARSPDDPLDEMLAKVLGAQ